MTPGAVLAGAGTLRVDRKKALEKLKDFQLPDAGMYLLPWTRCAVASGATRIGVAVEGRRVEIRFDGRPLSRDDLQDPFAALFEAADPAKARLRHLAVGLLSALRLDPRSVTLAGGEGAGRFGVLVESLEKAGPIPADPGRETFLRVDLGSAKGREADPSRHLRLLEAACRACPVPIRANGRDLPRPQRTDDEPGVAFDGEGQRGWVAVPPRATGLASVEAHLLGALVGPIEFPVPLVPVAGLVADDAFSLDASQTGIQRDDRHARAVDRLAREADRLLLEVAGGWGETFAKAARLVYEEGLHRTWRAGIERGPEAASGGILRAVGKALAWILDPLQGRDPRRRGPLVREVLHAARVAVWLREAAGRAAGGPPGESSPPLARALWTCPLYLGVHGGTLSLAALHETAGRLGYLPASRRRERGTPLLFEAAWCPSPKEEKELQGRFGDRVRDVTKTLDDIQDAFARDRAGTGVDGAPALELTGVFRWLVRDRFKAGNGCGEAGLPREPLPGGARVSLFRGSLPAGEIQVPGDLRFRATYRLAGSEDASGDAARIAQAALETARSLYRRVAGEVRDGPHARWEPGAVAHLLDFVLDSVRRSGAARPVETDRWIERLHLFARPSDSVSLRALREAFDDGKAIAVFPYVAAFGNLKLEMAVLNRPPLDDGFLRTILPGTAILRFPPSDSRLLFRAPWPPCEHPPAKEAGCVADVPTDTGRLHLLAELASEGPRAVFPFGAVKALPEGEVPPPEGFRADDECALRVLAAILHRHGTLIQEPAHPARRVLLEGAAHYLSPWPGPPGHAVRRLVADVLGHLPVFRDPSGQGVSLHSLHDRLQQIVVWVPPAGAERAGHNARLILDEWEAECISRLWPGSGKNLVSWRAGQAVSEGEIPPWLAFPFPTVFTRRYAEAGLDVHLAVGLYESQSRECFASGPDGSKKPIAADLQALGFPGCLRADLAGWKGGPGSGLVAVLERLALRFQRELAAAWPLGGGEGPIHDAAVRHLLHTVAQPTRPGAAARGMEDLKKVFSSFPICRTLGGDPADLRHLRMLADARGRLDLAHPPGGPCRPHERGIPVLDANLVWYVQRALRPGRETQTRLWSPPRKAAAAPAIEPPEEDEEPADGEVPPAVLAARRILDRLRGLHGSRLWLGERRARTLRLSPEKGDAPLRIRDDGGWELRERHPMVRAVLDSALPPDAQGAYLASIAYTSANRQIPSVTDEDDVRFQESLAEFLADPGGG